MNILKFTDEILRERVSSYCLATGQQLSEDWDQEFNLKEYTDQKTYPINGHSDAVKHAKISDAVSMYIGMNGLMLDRPNVFLVGTLNNSNLTLVSYEAVHSDIEAAMGQRHDGSAVHSLWHT